MSYPRFCLILNDKVDVNLLKAGDPGNRTWPRFYLTHDDKLGVNLPKAGDPRNEPGRGSV